jgi:hypothetical protein
VRLRLLFLVLLGVLTLLPAHDLAGQSRSRHAHSSRVRTYTARHYSSRSYTHRHSTPRYRSVTVYSRPTVRRFSYHHHYAAHHPRARLYYARQHTRRTRLVRVGRPRHLSYSAPGTRDQRGRLRRSTSAKDEFMRRTGYPRGRPGYVVDHVVPLACGGADAPSNMQWQSAEGARAKDRVERRGCRR